MKFQNIDSLRPAAQNSLLIDRTRPYLLRLLEEPN
jgi:hypothetical protein